MTNVRSITPLPPADFTPEIGNYKTLKPFSCWSQKVLPLVYDDSLSYYEDVCKLTNKMNEVIEIMNNNLEKIVTEYVDKIIISSLYLEEEETIVLSRDMI